MSIGHLLGFLGPIATVVSIVVSAMMIRRQMQLRYQLAIRDKSLSYSLYSNMHLRDARIKVEAEFGSLFSIEKPIAIAVIEEKQKSDPELYASMLTLLAHWENMALSISTELADNNICFEMVGSTLIQHVKIFGNFIACRREANVRAYDHLLDLAEEWTEKLRPQRRTFDPIKL